MTGARAAIRYAKAVLSLAFDEKSTDEINNDMQLIANTVAENKDLSDMLQSPVVPSSIKKSASFFKLLSFFFKLILKPIES